MMSPLPSLRSLIVCEDVLTNTSNPPQATLVNLVSFIRASGGPPYPLRLPRLCVFAQIAECRGPAVVRVEVREEEAEADEVVFATRPRRVLFPNDPLAVYHLRFRITACVFPRPGLYWVHLLYDDRLLGQQPLTLK
jgi:hypothetical protein